MELTITIEDKDQIAALEWAMNRRARMPFGLTGKDAKLPEYMTDPAAFLANLVEDQLERFVVEMEQSTAQEAVQIKINARQEARQEAKMAELAAAAEAETKPR